MSEMKWISVEEQPVPRDDGTYLVASVRHGFVAPYIRQVIHNNCGHSGDWDFGVAITHWAPLPAPPNEMTQKEEG